MILNVYSLCEHACASERGRESFPLFAPHGIRSGIWIEAATPLSHAHALRSYRARALCKAVPLRTGLFVKMHTCIYLQEPISAKTPGNGTLHKYANILSSALQGFQKIYLPNSPRN